MIPNYKNLRVVPYLIFGRGAHKQLGDVLAKRRSADASRVVFMIDDVFKGRSWIDELPVESNDEVIYVNCDHEPKTVYVDELTRRVQQSSDIKPDALVAIGGGSTMDLVKAVSLMLNNEGSSADYQGWDLVPNPGVYKIGIPTLAGTGAEVSRTTVLTGPVRKLGINSDFTPFDQIILDPDMIADAPTDQRFFTAMDSYSHASESLNGTFINEFSRAFAEKSQDMVREAFLGDLPRGVADEKLMVASYFGGLSIAYSQVGVCHALSYGLSYVLGTRHGVGNCIVFDQLEDYYGDDVREFRQMLQKHDIQLPRGVTAGVTDEQMDKMVSVALSLDPLWENALGPNWREHMTPERARELYRRM
ncbi:MAG: iron-containing alcohol dehydrogenase [Verrucomicrobia bacterium]|nr:MAG: iron-containing alcohol dehydrogenase [Verrucomicrobiota bacterium]